MLKWIGRFLLLAVLVGLGYGGYYYYRSGLHSLPELQAGTYTVSFKNGFRGILHDMEVEDDHTSDSPRYFRWIAIANPSRKYLGVPMDVAPWFEDVWSECYPPSEDDFDYVDRTMPDETKVVLQGARFEAVCIIPVDEGAILRGMIYSVPRQ